MLAVIELKMLVLAVIVLEGVSASSHCVGRN